MPSQIRIINAVNQCLQQKDNIEFELNRLGVCAGLAGLYIKYTLENKQHLFFSTIDRLANLPKDYSIGKDPIIDDFIIQIEKVFNPRQYNGHEPLLQGDLDQILSIGAKPLINEFNFGLVAKEVEWERILEQITHPNRSYYIVSENHSIALSLKDGKYVIYDPNYNQNTKEFSSAKAAISEIKKCFAYEGTSFGLTIRAFANPNTPAVTYPSHAELHQLVSPAKMDASSQKAGEFAANGRDIETFRHLVQRDASYWEKLNNGLIVKETIDLLLEQPKSTAVRLALLNGISLNFRYGNIDAVHKLIAHFQKHYTTIEAQDLLQGLIESLLEVSATLDLIIIANFDEFLKLCKELGLNQKIKYHTSINQLQLLTLLHDKAEPKVIDDFLKHLSPRQLIKQIQCAAIKNQQQLLNLLINAAIAPEFLTTVFTPKLIKHISYASLKKLLTKGFIPDIGDQKLLPRFMQRKDKTLFRLIAKAWARQSNQQEIWKSCIHEKSTTPSLTAMIGPISVLSALVFLRQNSRVFKADTANLSNEQFQNALLIAIMDNNAQMSEWLHKQLLARHSGLDQETLEYIYKEALKKENLPLLNILTDLNYNVLSLKKDIDSLLVLCRDYNDYSIIFKSFEKASPPVKQQIIHSSLRWNHIPLAKHYAKNSPQYFNDLLNQSLTNAPMLAKLNQAARFTPAWSLTLASKDSVKKAIIIDFFKKNYIHLAKALMQTLTWNENELHSLFDELAQDQHENGLIEVIKIYPQLTQRLQPKQKEELFVAAVTNNKKTLVSTLLSQELINTLSQPLMASVMKAIEQGHYEVIETLLQSPLNIGLNYKTLFLYSCAQKQGKIANLLLVKKPILDGAEIQQAIQHLFGQQSESNYFETIYQQGYGRLYSLLSKIGLKNPRHKLLKSIKTPDLDIKFRRTELYMFTLKRALRANNEGIYNVMFEETSDLPSDVDENILNFLQDPIITIKVLPLFIKKYTLTALIKAALQQKKWRVVANLIEQSPLNFLDKELQIKTHGEQIIKDFIANLEANFDKDDVRPRLFTLLYSQNTTLLQQIAKPWYTNIQEALTRIELAMIAKNLNLNNQIYRHCFNNTPFSHLGLKEQRQQCTQAIEHYLNHRDNSLSYLSYFFDYSRGKTRAQHYAALIKSAQTKEELYVIEYALLSNTGSKQLKKDVVQGLECSDEQTTKTELKGMIKKSLLAHYLTQLDDVIDRINQKANSNVNLPTATLFQEEITFLRKICKPQSALGQHSFFQPQEPTQQTGFWHRLTNWFSSNNMDRLSYKRV